MDSALIKPRISVILPVYNSGLYIRLAIDSILNQSYPDFELICIDDGSTDNSLEIIKSYTDPRLKLVIHSENKGLIATLNEGMEMAQGEFIARMDADDISDPDRFKMQVEFLDKNPDIAVIAGLVQFIDHYGNPKGVWNDDMAARSEDAIRQLMPARNCIAHPSIMIRTLVMKKYRYRSGFYRSEDWGMWLEMLGNGERIAKLDQTILQYRIHPGSLTSNPKRSDLYGRILGFKRKYLSEKFSRKEFKSYDYRILTSYLKNILTYPRDVWFRNFRETLGKIIKARPLSLLLQAFTLNRELNKLSEKKYLFFFPFCHIGGAEIVHAQIISTIKDQKPLVFFTKQSDNSGLLDEFKKYAICIDIGNLCSFPVFRSWALQRLIKFVRSAQPKLLFGCNSHVYYQLLEHLDEKANAMDLIHAFVHPQELGAEHWSLPVASKLKKRVFISHFAMKQMKDMYAKNGLNQKLDDNMVFISNATCIPELVNSEIHSGETLQVVYVGRATPEKRVNLIGRISKILNEKIGIKIKLIGPDASSVDETDRENCVFTGELRDRSALTEVLKTSHILLLTSSREGMPLVIMEAMAYGLVPMSTPVGDIPHYIKDGKNGYLLDGEDPDVIVNQAVELILKLNNDRQLLNKVRPESRRTALDNFSESDFNKKYRELFLGKEVNS